MDPLVDAGECLLVPERVIVAPAVGIFRPADTVGEAPGEAISEGQAIGVVEGPGSSTPVRSPFRGHLMGMMAGAGDRVREGQALAWLRIA
ncbi:MAG: biotin/lipoyl-containing protein [Acidimicrobiia bacterium]